MDFDVVIIGGGVVGLACAAESAARGFSTILVERHTSFGQETSSRNSEVIHSGIYYPTGSLKAKLCVTANHNLYRECQEMNVWHRRCGKLIVAVTPEETPELEKLYRGGVANGVEGMELLDPGQAGKLEPNVLCHAAIFLPGTGIIDSHELMSAYMHLAKSHGAAITFGVDFTRGEKKGDAYELSFRESAGTMTTLTSRYVINAAGLSGDKVAASFGIDVDAAGYRILPNRGHYYTVSSTKSRMISRLVYPMPHRHLVSAGIHITTDRAGQCKLGPDTEYIDPSVPESDWYKFDDTRKGRFHAAVVRYFPALEPADLSPGQVGVRPKLTGSGTEAKDFIICEESARGLDGLVNLIGIESPGLTCAREIARMVVERFIH